MTKKIAHVEAQKPPESVRTLRDWLEWRVREDARMLDEVKQQVEAHFEREDGATEH